MLPPTNSLNISTSNITILETMTMIETFLFYYDQQTVQWIRHVTFVQKISRLVYYYSLSHTVLSILLLRWKNTIQNELNISLLWKSNWIYAYGYLIVAFPSLICFDFCCCVLFTKGMNMAKLVLCHFYFYRYDEISILKTRSNQLVHNLFYFQRLCIIIVDYLYEDQPFPATILMVMNFIILITCTWSKALQYKKGNFQGILS